MQQDNDEGRCDRKMDKKPVTLLCLFSLICLCLCLLRQAAHLQPQASSESLSLWSELLAKPCLRCGPLVAAFLKVNPLRDSFATKFSGRYRQQLRPRSIRQHQCSTSTSCQCRSSWTAHLLPPSWRSQTTRRRFLLLQQPIISTTLLHPTNPKMQLPNPYAQQLSPAPQAYCSQQSRTR